jgi:hypothetical protein
VRALLRRCGPELTALDLSSVSNHLLELGSLLLDIASHAPNLFKVFSVSLLKLFISNFIKNNPKNSIII